jgi:hypothetical protein
MIQFLSRKAFAFFAIDINIIEQYLFQICIERYSLSGGNSLVADAKLTQLTKTLQICSFRSVS